jgi:tetratricopeptide (TPR) repeat protein
MPAAPSRYQIGDVGSGATVLQGEYLNNITLNVSDVAAAAELLRSIREGGKPAYHGPLLRRLDPIVLVNRADSIRTISAFFSDPATSLLYVCGMAGIGKSTLVRGAIELRKAETPAIWIGCDDLDADHLLADIAAGMGLGAELALGQSRARLATRIASVLGAIAAPGIVVLDGLEALLDDKGAVVSKDLAETVEALATLEHKLKVLVTTRQLPAGAGAGVAGVGVLHLAGLPEPMAQALLLSRMRRDGNVPPPIPTELLRKLGGHPKIIELVASATFELPIEQLSAGVSAAADVHAFVMAEIFARIDAEETRVLRAALVFRDAFPFDALRAVCDAAEDGGVDIQAPVRALVRRAVLDAVAGPPLAYFLHPILRDAAPRSADEEAAAHGAAAEWRARTPMVASEVATWDDRLYHLRRAAETARRPDHIAAYLNWVFEHGTELEYAGWPRREVAELRALRELTRGQSEAAVVSFKLGQTLSFIGELDEAIVVLDDLSRAVSDLPAESTVVIKAKLGFALAKRLRLDEATRVADELESIVSAGDDVQQKLRYCELRFEIARQSVQLAKGPVEKEQRVKEMLRLANNNVVLANQWYAADPSIRTRDAVAEAHFNLGVACLRAGDHGEMFRNFGEQLRIKLEIGKLGGVVLGLYNLGAILLPLDSSVGAALLLTADQIALETELDSATARLIEEARTLFEEGEKRLLSEAEKCASAGETVSGISARLSPYFQRALDRRAGTVLIGTLAPG